MNKHIKLIITSIAVLALIGAEFYLLLSTKLQVSEIKTKVSQIENKIKQKKVNSSEGSQSKIKTNESTNEETQEQNSGEDKEKDTDKQATSFYTSQKLESPEGDKLFYFQSKNSKIKEKSVENINFNSVYNNTKEAYCIGKDNCFSEEIQIRPMIEYKNNNKKLDLTSVFLGDKIVKDSSKIIGWHDNESLLSLSSFGDAGFVGQELYKISINKDVKTIYSCSKSPLKSSCTYNDYVIITTCKDGLSECSAIESYKISADSMKSSSSRFSKKDLQNEELLDRLDSQKKFMSVDLNSKFNLREIGKKLKIKYSSDPDKYTIFDFNKEKFIKQ